MPPCAGRCGTYAGLVQSLAPDDTRSRHGPAEDTQLYNANGAEDGQSCVAPAAAACSSRFHDEAAEDTTYTAPTAQDCRPLLSGHNWNSVGGGGACAVCDRKHGRPCEYSEVGSLGERGTDTMAVKKADWLVQAADSLKAFEHAHEVYRMVYGEDNERTIETLECLNFFQSLRELKRAQLGY